VQASPLTSSPSICVQYK